ncbi:sigma factor-like helix-turn-helix DNA-binding protein [Sphingomonas sp. RT2P30]|uniref:sigma factor-like helix-turn-helix DNA-binding protein n=1 Tax=Parasphingomonas halimpatiens TaxID=3096162 RepID=UPI002FCB84B7
MSEELSDAAILERLAAGLKSMPPYPKAVFVRHRFDDASYAEIAAELRITTAEVEGHIAAAVLHLHKAVWT